MRAHPSPSNLNSYTEDRAQLGREGRTGKGRKQREEKNN
jgi:hypothetical protein